MAFTRKKIVQSLILLPAISSFSLFSSGCAMYENTAKSSSTPHYWTKTINPAPEAGEPHTNVSQHALPQRTRQMPKAPAHAAPQVVAKAPSTQKAPSSMQDDGIMGDLLGDILEPLGNNSAEAKVQDILTAAPRQNYSTYTVQKGDSLWLISKKTSTPLGELMTENGLTRSSVLRIGQVLKVEGAGATAATTAPAANVPYTVQRGDTLSGIALKAGVKTSELKRMNSLSSNVIYVGQKLNLPKEISSSSSNIAAAPKAKPVISGPTYTVKSGQTLSDIALAADMKIKDLMDMNGITDPRKLRAGQKIQVTASASDKLAQKAPSSSAIMDSSAASAAASEVAAAPSAPKIVQTEAQDLDVFMEEDDFFSDDSLFDMEEEIPVISIENSAS